MTNHPSLRAIVLATAGQDVCPCCNCALCSEMASDDQDITLEELVQSVIMNDGDTHGE